MYELIMFFGPASITYGIVHALVKNRKVNGINALIETIAYAFVNSMMTILLLEPMGKIQIITGTSAMPHVVYGAAGLAVSSIFGVVLGIALAVLFTRVHVEMQSEEEKDDTENEK